jgi:hypothetical protein
MNEFMFLLPLFNFVEEILEKAEKIILAYGDSVSVSLFFISAIFMVALPVFHLIPQKVKEPFEQSLAWFSIHYQAERALWNETFRIRDSANFTRRKVHQDLLSSNPMKARRARKDFWGEDWKRARKELSAKQRLTIYKAALKK